MKNNPWGRNIIYLVLILLLFSVGVLLFRNYNSQLAQTFKSNVIYLTLIQLISFGGIGAVLGLDKLSSNWKKEGKWKVNKAKLIILGIPSCIISMSFIWAFLGLRIDYFMPNDYIGNVMVISNMILGHTLTSSFYKD